MNLLKRLKPLDYLIIISLLSLVIYFMFFIRQQQSWVTVTVISRDVPLYLTNTFNKGDVEKDPSGDKSAEIIDKTLYPSRNDNTTTRDMFLTVNLLAAINKKTNETEYKSKAFTVGSPIELRFNSGLVQGVVIKVNPQNNRQLYKTVTVRAYMQHSWLAEKLVVGQGDNEIIQLLSKQIVPTQFSSQIASSSPDTPIVGDQNQDIIMRLKVLGEENKGKFLFANQKPIAVGDTFSFYVGNVYIREAVITDLQ